MDLLTNRDFEGFAAGLGLAFRTPRLPKSLAYRPPRGPMYAWAVPADSRRCLALVDWALDGLDPWDSCALWPFAGLWPGDVDLPGVGFDRATWPLLLRGAGIPGGWEGAVRVRRDRADVVKAVAFTFAAFGSSSQDDLFVVPDHGRQFIHLDPWHSDPADPERALPALKVHFAAPASAGRFAAHMARASFDPPVLTEEGGDGPDAGAGGGREPDPA